jgi:hypothetical protein
MEVCSRSADLVSPSDSAIRGVQDSAACADGKPAGRRWESNTFYRLIEE